MEAEQRKAALARYAKKTFTIVLKLGTSSICDEKTHFPLLSNLSALVETVVKLRGLGHRIVVVSSGAVGTGLRRLNLEKKPKHLAQIQVGGRVVGSKDLGCWKGRLNVSIVLFKGSGCCRSRPAYESLR